MRNGFAKAITLALILVLVMTQAPLTIGQQSQQNSGLGVQARDLNNQLLTVFSRLKNPRPGETPAALRSQGSSILGQRAAVLEALIEESPKQVLSLAFSQDLLTELAAAFPDSTRDLEAVGEWEGPLQVTVEDSTNLISHKTSYRMRSNTGQALNIHFDDEQDLQSGDVLRVRGVRVRSEVAAADGGTITGTSPAAASICSPLGSQRSIVLLVHMPGTTPPAITLDSANKIFFGSTGRSVSEFWRENSYGQSWAEGDAKGWYTLDANYSCDQYEAIRDAAIRAADKDVDFSRYNRVFIIMSGNSGNCGYAGLGDVGCGSTLKTAEGTFVVSTAWMQSGYFENHDQGVQLAIHEGGHNLGLSHASSRDFGAEALGAPGDPGTLSEYGDYFSTMGFWNFGHYGAPHKVKLGWLTGYLTVTGNGSFAVQPTETYGNLQALKIQRGADPSKYLWLEFRQKTGLYDATLLTQIFNGGLVHYQDSATNKTHLIDFTPTTTTFSDPALVGAWTDPYTNLSIGVTNPTSSAVNVDVFYGTVPCTTATPTVALSPSNPSVYEGGNVNYTVTIANNDSSACLPRSFTLSSLVPGTWPTTFAQTVITVPPASRASTEMTKSVPAGTAAATYSVDAIASSESNSVEGLANLTVMPTSTPPPPAAPLSITLTAPSAPIKNTVSIVAQATQGTTAASGATVIFTMVTPTGTATRKTTTDSTGRALWSFKVNPKTAKGSYVVTAQATLGSQTAMSSSVTFTVQ